jgi:drug/metabolite transporter (DMT)-like permease
MKWIVLGLCAVFMVALAIVVGKQMSADAMAVVIGVVCGIAASIPTSLAMLMLLNRRQEQPDPQRSMPQVPSVMIVNPGGGAPAPYFQQPAQQYLPPLQTGGRHFQVLGAEEYADAEGRYR